MTEQLLLFTEQCAADLLVVGANGLGLHIRFDFDLSLDGALQQLVEAARCPVLVARASYTRLRRVLLAVDFTWSRRRAVRYLARFHLPSHVKVTVMIVQPPNDDPDPDTTITEPRRVKTRSGVTGLWDWLQSGFRSQEAWLHTRLGVTRYAAGVLGAGGANVDSVAARSDTAAAIASYARGHDVDLVVAGSRPLGAVASWITGDVTRTLIHGAGCSVLIVKDTAAKRMPTGSADGPVSSEQ